MNKPTAARPTEERITALDTLRGFAIFGILVVNILLFGTPYDVYDGVWTQPLDLVAAGFMLAFAEGKFYPVFSFLFGLGFMLQMDSAARRGTNFVPFFIRRMLILFGFGLVHALLFSHFDILAVYALLGLVLLALRNAPNPVLLGLALFSLALPFGVRLLGGLDYAALGFTGYSDAERLAIYQQGSFASIFVARLTDLAEYYLSVIEVSAGKIFAMFLLGAWVGRQGYLQYPTQHRRLLLVVLWGGAIIGISGGLIYAVTTLSGWEAASRLLSLGLRLYLAASDLALAAFYIVGVTLLCQHAAWQQRLAPLADVGRMALTNYIGQSVLATTIFYGYGLGLFGQFGAAMLLLLAVVIFALQVIFSRWWLQHFRMGPLEWLWRSLSYGKTTPLRRVVI
ncbi:MAG: DUF418 domain-containing protein [Chloroflexaceae bacterium]|nr:DUF418 domain-containing protein [Chloroflexaceae bacterium]